MRLAPRPLTWTRPKGLSPLISHCSVSSTSTVPEWEHSEPEFRRAIELDPNDATSHFLYAARHFREARVRLQQAIELEPELGQPHETLALVDLESGHPADAVKEAHAGLVLDPGTANTMGEAGYVLASVGQTDKQRRRKNYLHVCRIWNARAQLFKSIP